MALCAIVEDRPNQRRVLAAMVRSHGLASVECGSLAEAKDIADAHRPELMLLDLGLPDGDGLELIPIVRRLNPLCRIVVLTGRDSVREAVDALRAGANHYLVKPWDSEELELIVKRELAAVNRQTTELRSEGSSIFWGTNQTMLEIRRNINLLADSPNTNVLIRGATGTGKEVIARELHRLTGGEGPFVALNCAAVPHELLEAELFGHERGAFTGAEHRRRGLAEIADHGTLFLDEIAEMTESLQAKVLRFLQDGTFRPIGSEEEQRSSCRVVSATHQDLSARVESGHFRDDLLYRLAVVTLTIPPLKDRREDILPLIHVLLKDLAHRLGRPPKPMSAPAERAVAIHTWPGNVRELRNRIERALVLGTGDQIQPVDLDLESDATDTRALRQPDNSVLDDPARLRLVLEHEGWNMARVARRLGVARHVIKYRVAKFELARTRG